MVLGVQYRDEGTHRGPARLQGPGLVSTELSCKAALLGAPRVLN